MHNEVDVAEIEAQARRELEYEQFREAVERRKTQIVATGLMPWWRRLFPFRITLKIERIKP